jgi:pyridine nucleotide-disulfide oxidoreductase family protein
MTRRRLLLVGAGHAHLAVLADLARAPIANVDVTLLTPYPRQIYSGMLPGWIAGHYSLDQCAIPVAPLADRANVRLALGSLTRLDLLERRAWVDTRGPIDFDVISIDTGAVVDTGHLPGVHEHAIALRPIESFIVAWQRLHAQFAADAIAAHDDEVTQPKSGARTVPALTVVGGGAAGVEVALAIAWRFAGARVPLRLQLVAGRVGVLPTLPPHCRRRVLRHLVAQGVRVIDDDATAVERHGLTLDDGGDLPSDVTLVATGTAAAAWPRAAGLAVDGRGFIGIAPNFQSLSHPFVFAAGDCASMIDHPRAKSGVYAVRAGPPLAANLRRALAGESPMPYRPQRRALYLLATGGKHAIASWGGFSIEGDWAWRWKDSIDRRFVAQYVRE